MSRLRFILAAGLVALVAATGSSAAAPPKLIGTVGPDKSFAIKLTQNGHKVKKLKAGKYVIVIHDTATIHNFHLKGPGLNKKTSVAGKGTKTWKVTLAKGKYTYLCDPHSLTMRGTFTVT
jgi:plastocyanin